MPTYNPLFNVALCPAKLGKMFNWKLRGVQMLIESGRRYIVLITQCTCDLWNKDKETKQQINQRPNVASRYSYKDGLFLMSIRYLPPTVLRGVLVSDKDGKRFFSSTVNDIRMREIQAKKFPMDFFSSSQQQTNATSIKHVYNWTAVSSDQMVLDILTRRLTRVAPRINPRRSR